MRHAAPDTAPPSGSQPQQQEEEGSAAAAGAPVLWVNVRFAESVGAAEIREAAPAGSGSDGAQHAEKQAALSSAAASDAVLKTLTSEGETTKASEPATVDAELRKQLRDAVGRLEHAVTRLHEFKERWGRKRA